MQQQYILIILKRMGRAAIYNISDNINNIGEFGKVLLNSYSDFV